MNVEWFIIVNVEFLFSTMNSYVNILLQSDPNNQAFVTLIIINNKNTNKKKVIVTIIANIT